MNWTEDEITIVLYEYCLNPFGQFNERKQFVIDLGGIIGRTPGAIVRKVGNLASFDPQMRARGVGGLSHTSRLDKVIWDRYYGKWDQLAFEAEKLKARLSDKNIEDNWIVDLENLPRGLDREQLVRTRINQSFFREAVLHSYSQTCCISGINNPSLLEASHIVGWTEDESLRTNPKNDLCLNVLLHKAYDENLLGISPDYTIHISDDFFGRRFDEVDEKYKLYYSSLNNKKIHLPDRFLPERDYLAAHYEKYCNRNN